MSATPKIRGLRARPALVPMNRPLHTASGAIDKAPLVLVDVETDAGITGSSYVFTYAPFALKSVVALLDALGELIKGEPVDPVSLSQMLAKRFALMGGQGFTMIAAAGIDMACWDIAAKAANLPLVKMLGGTARPVQGYNSCGLGIMGAAKAAKEAEELVAPGFNAIKVRLGYPTREEDVAVVRAIRKAIGERVTLMSDYNQSLLAPEAQARAALLDHEGLYWIEEPVRFDDYAGCARIARDAATAIQIGENCWGPHDMEKALAADACDYFMADAVKIGGVSGWLHAAGMAQARGMPLSSHLFPEVSVHLLAVSPTCHWLEYVDWASPLLQEPVVIKDGFAQIPERAGIGMSWNEEMVRRCLVG
jgi:mandelate racemase